MLHSRIERVAENRRSENEKNTEKVQKTHLASKPLPVLKESRSQKKSPIANADFIQGPPRLVDRLVTTDCNTS